MRILSCFAEAFGLFSEMRVEEMDAPLVVVTGPNEAGKSTFFRFLRSMLFGFSPARADKHPYQPEATGFLAGSLRYRAQNGEEGTVSRKLMSSPVGALEVGGSVVELRNRVLPLVEHIPLAVYESVYAITLHEMTAIEGRAWEEVEQRLLGGMTLDFLRPAGTVLAEIETEAAKLWRPTRRGQPEAAKLADRLKQLRSDYRDAIGNDDQLRSLVGALETIEQAIAALQEDRIRMTSRRRTLGELVPIRKLWLQVEGLRDEAGDITELSDLPEDPRGQLELLDREATEAGEDLLLIEADVKRLRKAVQSHKTSNRDILKYRTEVRDWVRRTDSHEEKQSGVRKLEAAEKELRKALDERVPAVLDKKMTAAVAESVRNLSAPQLDKAIQLLESSTRDLEMAEVERRSLTVNRRDTLPLVLALVLFLATIGLVIGWDRLGQDGYLEASVGTGLAGLALLVVAIWQRRRFRKAIASLKIESHEEEQEQQRKRIRSLLGAFAPSETDGPLSRESIEPVLAVRTMVVEWHNTRSGAATLRADVEREVAAIEELSRQCGLPTEADPATLLNELDRKLRATEAGEAEVESKANQLEGLLPQEKRLRSKKISARTHLKTLVDRLEREGQGNYNKGILEVGRRRKAWVEAEGIEQRLRREYPNLEDRLREIRALEQSGDSLVTDDTEIVRIDSRIKELGEQIEVLVAEKSAKENERDVLLKAEAASEIASQIALMEQERSNVWRRHDRLTLLAGILRHAETLYRHRHQPEVLRRAGELLSNFTKGKYERLLVQEGSNRLLVLQSGSEFPISVDEPLSQGTRDQIYLALRLAIVDQLDKRKERLPLFMDEIFVNWDEARRQEGIALLHEESKRRQVFLFTCHPWFAEELSARARALVINLSDLAG